jgi:tetratricopeptide (TPR) repeat protein
MADLLPCLDESSLHPEAITWLAESLAFDPDELDVYLRLMRVYRAQRDLKSARALLDDALRRFPANARVLLEAIETALAGDAFKKAVGYAHKVLELDPINPRVRSLLGQAHLAHARKQLRSGKIEAARKELVEAGAWLRAPADQATLKLLQSLCEFQDGETARGQQIVRDAFTEFGSDVVGWFRLAIEFIRLSRDPAKCLRETGVETPRTISAEDILALMHGLDAVAAEPAHLRKVIALLLKPLKTGASQFSREADFLLICENCHRHGLNELALIYAETAQKRFRSSPVFVYHAAQARYGERPWSIPHQALDQLERARDLAEQTGDRRTVVRIDRLLMMPEPYFDPGPMPFLPGAGTPFGEMLGPLDGPDFDMLMALLGEQGLIDFARNALGKKAFQEMERELGKANLIPALKALLGSATQQAGPMPPHPAPKPGKPKDGPEKRLNDDRQRDLFDD